MSDEGDHNQDNNGESVQFDVGEYFGSVVNERPHGHGKLDFKTDDLMGRKYYEGQWNEGKITGKGRMVFTSGDVYSGDFDQGVPHGQGEFTYANGDVETAHWENGDRHGLSRYVSTSENTVEEAMFWEGVADGPATIRSADGSVEELNYSQGIRDGEAKRKMANGDEFEFSYVKGEISGNAIVTRSGGGREECHYVNGLKVGPAVEYLGDGSKEEHSYTRGVLSGAAILHGANGDRVEFSYRDGKKFGPCVYHWSDGSIEHSIYNDDGIQSGPAQLTWPNGAVRQGQKVDGKWNGQVFYLYAEGPRKGKRDVETWENGEMVGSQKYYGEGEAIVINNWEDLKKLDDPTASMASATSSPEKDVFYDCISSSTPKQ